MAPATQLALPPIVEWNVRTGWTPEALEAELDAIEKRSSSDVDWRRFEIVDGLIVMSPPRTLGHAYTTTRLALALHDREPRGSYAIGSTMIDLHPSYLVTDVTVLAEGAFQRDDTTVPPADVLLAVEVESPSSITTDRITKPALYAAAGIAHYWRLETDPLRLHAYRLADDSYVPAGSWGPGERAQLEQPFAVEFDIDALARV